MQREPARRPLTLLHSCLCIHKESVSIRGPTYTTRRREPPICIVLHALFTTSSYSCSSSHISCFAPKYGSIHALRLFTLPHSLAGTLTNRSFVFSLARECVCLLTKEVTYVNRCWTLLGRYEYL